MPQEEHTGKFLFDQRVIQFQSAAVEADYRRRFQCLSAEQKRQLLKAAAHQGYAVVHMTFKEYSIDGFCRKQALRQQSEKPSFDGMEDKMFYTLSDSLNQAVDGYFKKDGKLVLFQCSWEKGDKVCMNGAIAKFLQEIKYHGVLEDIDIIYANFSRCNDNGPNRWRCEAVPSEKPEHLSALEDYPSLNGVGDITERFGTIQTLPFRRDFEWPSLQSQAVK